MEPAPRNRISDLYHRALDCTPEERGAFLQEACGSDAVLRDELESLLRYEPDSPRFLETPAAVVGSDRGETSDDRHVIGRQLGPYTVLAPLGAGGMGEVYRARDSKLRRDVAIKILPSHFTSDPERRSRFAREARLLATLNHPHIGAIFGLEESDGLTALVLELVEGPTLAHRLLRGPLSISDALAIARQIADALDAAHEKGIIHRDLKPANIVLQSDTNAAGVPSGARRAKVLDFGLAKTMATAMDGTSTLGASSPSAGTAEGRILGTPAYMSPEQARGEAVDKRTDIWAFGCVLFEMLSGNRAFDGKTIADTLARILEREPDWAALPAETPAGIRALLERCLRKDPHQRLHDIADARIELDDGIRPVAATGTAATVAPAAPRRGRERLGWIVAAALAVALGGMALLSRRDLPPAAPEHIEFPIAAAEGSRFSRTSPEFAISPDGRHVAFVGAAKEGSMLWVRSLAALEPRALPGTERARNPFWSPDSQSLGYFADDRLKTIQVNGGSPVVVCPAAGTLDPTGPSGTWNRNDVIVFAERLAGLRQVAAKGGNPTPVTTLPKTDTAHLWPWFLPDGEHFLYLAQSGGTSDLRVGSLTSADSVSLGPSESQGAYAAGHLFYVRGGNLMAQPFDEDARQPKGAPLRLGAQTGVHSPGQRGVFSVSETGRLVYRSTARTISQLTWVNRQGVAQGLVGDPGLFMALNLSRDDQRVAMSQLKQQPGGGAEYDISLIDLATGRSARLSDDPAGKFDPAWSPSGTQVAFGSARVGLLSSGLFVRASNSSGVDVPLVPGATGINVGAPDWSPDDIIVYSNGFIGDADLWTLSLSGNRTPTVFLKTKNDESAGAFSPDGRWIAYQSNASGRLEVYVRPFPARDPLVQVSRDGGGSPRWRGDGKELFLLSPDGAMMAARIDTTTGLASVPDRLFPTQLNSGYNRPYAVTRDGQRFLIPIATQQPLTAVLDWRSLVVK